MSKATDILPRQWTVQKFGGTSVGSAECMVILALSLLLSIILHYL
jgi:aspartokinase